MAQQEKTQTLQVAVTPTGGLVVRTMEGTFEEGGAAIKRLMQRLGAKGIKLEAEPVIEQHIHGPGEEHEHRHDHTHAHE